MSKLFQALQSGSPEGAPQFKSNTPAVPSPAPLSPGEGNPFLALLTLPDNIKDATKVSEERIMAGLGKAAYGPALPEEPLPAEKKLSEDALSAVSAGAVAPVRQAPMGKMAQQAKELLDEASRNNAPMIIQKKLMQQFQRLLELGR